MDRSTLVLVICGYASLLMALVTAAASRVNWIAGFIVYGSVGTGLLAAAVIQLA